MLDNARDIVEIDTDLQQCENGTASIKHSSALRSPSISSVKGDPTSEVGGEGG